MGQGRARRAAIPQVRGVPWACPEGPVPILKEAPELYPQLPHEAVLGVVQRDQALHLPLGQIRDDAAHELDADAGGGSSRIRGRQLENDLRGDT